MVTVRCTHKLLRYLRGEAPRREALSRAGGHAIIERVIRMNPQSASTRFISVIVPTRNRARSLRRTLEAFARQTYPADSFELLVIANDCCELLR